MGNTVQVLLQHAHGRRIRPLPKYHTGERDGTADGIFLGHRTHNAKVRAVHGLPCFGTHNAVWHKPERTLQINHRSARGRAKRAVNAHCGNGVVVGGKKAQVVLQAEHTRAAVPLAQHPGELLGDFFKPNTLGVKLVESFYACVNGLNFIPGRAPHNAVRREIEDLLKGANSRLGVFHKNAVGLHDFGNGGIVLRYAVESDLHGAHVVAHVAHAQRKLGNGSGQARYGHVCDNVNVVAVIGGQNFVRGEAAIGKIDRSPL